MLQAVHAEKCMLEGTRFPIKAGIEIVLARETLAHARYSVLAYRHGVQLRDTGWPNQSSCHSHHSSLVRKVVLWSHVHRLELIPDNDVAITPPMPESKVGMVAMSPQKAQKVRTLRVAQFGNLDRETRIDEQGLPARNRMDDHDGMSSCRKLTVPLFPNILRLIINSQNLSLATGRCMHGI